MEPRSTAEQRAEGIPGILGRIDIRGRLARLPLPVQAIITLFLAQLLALDIALPDILPLVDEVILGWLLYLAGSTSVATIRERYGERIKGWCGQALGSESGEAAIADEESTSIEQLDNLLAEATRRELEALDPAF